MAPPWRQPAREGYSAAQRHSASLVILNTCTVTGAADDDVRQTLRRIRRENPSARILVTGCYAQRAPEEVAALPGVVWVVGNSTRRASPNCSPAALPTTVRSRLATSSPSGNSWLEWWRTPRATAPAPT